MPVTLLGLSWGGKLATAVAATKHELIDGLVLLYPGIRSRFETSLCNHLRLSLARRLEVFDKRIRIPLDDPALFTAQPKWQDFIRNDRLALHDVTVAFLLANREYSLQSVAMGGRQSAPRPFLSSIKRLLGRLTRTDATPRPEHQAVFRALEGAQAVALRKVGNDERRFDHYAAF